MKEQIEHPDYYTSGGIEVADFIEAHELNFNRGNIVKYVARAGKKSGETALTALLKAQQYLSREIVRVGHEQEELEHMLEGMRPAYCLPEDRNEEIV